MDQTEAVTTYISTGNAYWIIAQICELPFLLTGMMLEEIAARIPLVHTHRWTTRLIIQEAIKHRWTGKFNMRGQHWQQLALHLECFHLLPHIVIKYHQR